MVQPHHSSMSHEMYVSYHAMSFFYHDLARASQ